MLGRVATWVLTLSVATGLAACGGDNSKKRAAKADFIARADAICAQYEPQLRALPRPRFNPIQATAADMPAAAAYVTQRIPIAERESAALHALGTPSQDASTFKRALAGFDSTISVARDELIATRAGEVGRFKRDFNRERSAGVQASRLTGRFGLRVCGARGR